MKVIFIAFLILTSTLACSQADSTRSPHHHMIGLSASIISGYGLTYGYKFDGYNTIKANLFAFIKNDESGPVKNDDKYLSFGIEYQQSFSATYTPRWYFLVGGFYSLHWNHHIYESTLEPQDHTTLFKRYGGGVGVGVEFSFFHRILANVDIGFTLIDDNEDGDIFLKGPYIGPGAGIGLMYSF